MIERFFRKPFTVDRIGRLVFLFLLLAGLGWGIGKVGHLLVTFALAWLVAYLLLPIVKFVQYKMRFRSRGLSIAFVILILLGIIVGIVALLIPSISDEVRKAWELLRYYNVLELLLSLVPEQLRSQSSIFTEVESFVATINFQELVDSIQSLFSKSWNFLRDTLLYISGFAVVFIFFLYVIFILLDYETLQKGFYNILPKSVRSITKEVMDNVEYYVNVYFKGQIVISLVCSVLLSIGFYITGLPMGITFGLILGMLFLIPYLQLVGYIPMVMLVGLQSASTGQNFWVVLLFTSIVAIIVEILQQAVLTPLVHGRSMGMKPAAILLSLTVWGSIFGFLGMLFGLPLTMILYTLYMKYVVGEPVENGALMKQITKRSWKSHKRKEQTNEA